jgi:putative phosphoesterase
MRIALISDIHANLPALELVLKDIRTQGVDQIIFLGDAATIGPHPKETLELLRALKCVCILGNHDAALLEPARAADLQIAPSLLPTLEWGHGLLSESDFDFLRSFRPIHEVKLDGSLTLLCFHGSPRSNTELILSTTPDETLAGTLSGQLAGILAGGHTHVQMFRQHLEQVIINPGSVGSAFAKAYTPGGETPRLLPWAEYAIIVAEKGGWSADLRRVRFDSRANPHTMIAGGDPDR